MGVKVSFEGLTVGGDMEVLNGTRMNGAEDVDVEMENLIVRGKLSAMNNMEINSMMAELQERFLHMDRNSSEYREIQDILKVKRWNKRQFVERIGSHVVDFSKGVLASIIIIC